jgi:hypothetical protein
LAQDQFGHAALLEPVQPRGFRAGGKFSTDDAGLKLFHKRAKAMGRAFGFAVVWKAA